MWEFFIKCGQNFENVGNVGNVGPLGTLVLVSRPPCLSVCPLPPPCPHTALPVSPSMSPSALYVCFPPTTCFCLSLSVSSLSVSSLFNLSTSPASYLPVLFVGLSFAVGGGGLHVCARVCRHMAELHVYLYE